MTAGDWMGALDLGHTNCGGWLSGGLPANDCTSVWRDEFRVPKMVKCLFAAVNTCFVFRSGPQSNRAVEVVHG